MKIALTATFTFFLSGCVQSLFPWLSDETKAADVPLSGIWQDQGQAVAFVTEAKDGDHHVLMIGGDRQGLTEGRWTISLHRLNGTLLMNVGPPEDEYSGDEALLPGYFLFRVELAEDTAALYVVNEESLDDRIKGTKLNSITDEIGHFKWTILCSPTAELLPFLTSQLQDDSFFKAEPMFKFERIDELAPPFEGLDFDAPTPGPPGVQSAG